MLLGPVFRAELIGTSRRRRYYALRVAYGILLLLLLWVSYDGLRMRTMRGFNGLSIKEMASFAVETFVAFSILQATTILLLVPALVGGVIADEKQRKTLSFLLASRLSSGEIVLDKLAARLLHVGVFVAMGLPVVCLLSLLGGVPPEYVLSSYALTCTTTFFAAALAILISTFARRVRQGVLIAYLIELTWLLAPLLFELFLLVVFRQTFNWLGEINGLIASISPLALVLLLVGAPGLLRAAIPPFDLMAWMVCLQVVGGLVCVVIAVRGLRPIYRRQEAGSRRLNWFGTKLHRWRWLQRPSCGERAILWKECHFARTDVFTKLFVLPATVVLTVFLFFGSGIDEAAWRVCNELIEYGFQRSLAARLAFNEAIRRVSPYYIGLWLLAVAGASASSLSVEREEDTWLSLVATPLGGREILVGKMLGAVWGLRGFGALFGLIWLAGLVTGAVHPLGFLAALIALGVLTWFVCALGTFFSLRAKSTSRSIAATIGTLLALNGGYLIFLLPLLRFWEWHWLILGCTPYLTANCLLAVPDLWKFWGHVGAGWPLADPQVLSVTIGVIEIGVYAVSTALLTSRTMAQFDRWLGRPCRQKAPAIPTRGARANALASAPRIETRVLEAPTRS